MNAIEIQGLTKNFGEKQAVTGLEMTVPMGAIYGFIGENGSGKSTTEKLICGLIQKSGGSIKIFDKDYTDPTVRANMGCLIEMPGCFGGLSVWNNLMLQAENLGIKNAEEEVRRVLTLVRMEGSAGNKFKNCSLGMKQRIGIAMALMGSPRLLVLDEPINGLDADGMRIMREILTDITKDGSRSVVVSSHILSELEKIATHYGFIRGGKMIKEMSAEEFEADCPIYIGLKTGNNQLAKMFLMQRFMRVEEDEAENLRVYDGVSPEEVITYLYEKGVIVTEIFTAKISLEEYYVNLMKGKEGR